MAGEDNKETEVLEGIVKALVDHPEDIKIKRSVDEMGVLITLDVHPEDMGKVIGRKGNTAKAIRSLLRVVGMRNNARVNLKINEPEGSTRPPRPEMPGRLERPEKQERLPGAEQHGSRSVDEAVEDLGL
jgi:hypothetical protein